MNKWEFYRYSKTPIGLRLHYSREEEDGTLSVTYIDLDEEVLDKIAEWFIDYKEELEEFLQRKIRETEEFYPEDYNDGYLDALKHVEEFIKKS